MDLILVCPSTFLGMYLKRLCNIWWLFDTLQQYLDLKYQRNPPTTKIKKVRIVTKETGKGVVAGGKGRKDL